MNIVGLTTSDNAFALHKLWTDTPCKLSIVNALSLSNSRDVAKCLANKQILSYTLYIPQHSNNVMQIKAQTSLFHIFLTKRDSMRHNFDLL